MTVVNYDADSRLRAIAMNAIREAQLVYQRLDQPTTDDDAARMHDIFMLLHLNTPQTGYEHAPLSVTNTAPSKAVLKIADLLENIDLLEGPADSAPEAAPVKASVPKPSKA